jgi:hypothetical protein
MQNIDGFSTFFAAFGTFSSFSWPVDLIPH